MKMKAILSLGLSLLMLGSMPLSVGAYGNEKTDTEVYQVSPRYTTVRYINGNLRLNGNIANFDGNVIPFFVTSTSITATLQKQVGLWSMGIGSFCQRLRFYN